MTTGHEALTAARYEGPLPSVRAVAKMIDHALLRPELTPAELVALGSTATAADLAARLATVG